MMNIIELNRKIFGLTQKSLNVLSSIKWILDYANYKKYVLPNQTMRDSAGNKRCYILGNGPSLKSVDLSALQGKEVITVNKSVCTPVFDEIKPRFHVVIDRFILADVADRIEEELRKDNQDTIFILHRSGIERFSKYPRARFVYGTRMAFGKNAIRNDMTCNMTTFLNVLPFATLCATYFGYKEIVLLGNDFNFFAARKDQHFYDLESNKKRTESLYSDLAGCSIVLIEYKNLYNYAISNGIQIVNATKGSLLDEIPQVNLADYI